MTAVFQTVLNMSITGAYIATAIIVLRLVMKKLPKRFSYALWIILGIRLLCPFSFSSAASLFNLVKPETAENTVTTQMTYIPQNIEHAPKPQVTVAPPLLDNAVNEAITESLPPPTPENSVDPMQVVLFVAAIVWLAGVTVMAAYTVISYFSVRKKLAGATLLRDNIYICGNIGTPFVYGTVRPKIYLPEDIPEADTDYILAHERTHIRRGDHIVKLIAMAALCLHWFNPLVWVSYKLMTKDMELSCDERAVSRFDRDVRKDYANALLNISARQNHISLGGILAFGESNIKSRIKGVLAAKKPTVIVTALSVIAVAAAAVCLLTNAKNSAEDNPREMKTSYITFPFSEKRMAVRTTSSDEPFAVNFLLPTGWRYADPAVDGEAYWEGFSSPVNILDENDQIVGTVAFSRIEISYNGDEDYRSTVYEQIVLDYFESRYGDYNSVRSDQDGGSGITSVTAKDPETGTETPYSMILSYNTNISTYVGIRFKEDALTDEELEMIAESIYLTKPSVFSDEETMCKNYIGASYAYTYRRISESLPPFSGYTDSTELSTYMSLRLEYDTKLYGEEQSRILRDITINDGDIRRGELSGGQTWLSVPYEITYNVLEMDSNQVFKGNAYFLCYKKPDGTVRFSECYLGSDGDLFALGELSGEPPYELDYKAGAEKLGKVVCGDPRQLFSDYLGEYYMAVFNIGDKYKRFNIGKYTDSDELKTYLQLKMIYDFDAYERYDLITVGSGPDAAEQVQSGVKPDGTKWMTVPCEITYKDTWDGSESGWDRSAYFEYTDENGFVRMTAVADGSTGSHYAVDTLSQGGPPYDIYLKDGTEKLLNSPAVRRLTSSGFVIAHAGAEPTYLKEVCEPYIYDYWNYLLKLGDFEPSDYISDPDMLYYANSVKYRNAGYISHGIRELNGVILRLIDCGSISETRDWAYFKYDLGIVVDDISEFNENAFTGYTAYFEIDKTGGGYEIYRAYTNYELGDFGLPNEPLSFPLPNFDLKAAVRNNLRMDSFVITEPILHYDGRGGLSSTGQDDGDVIVRFSMPQNWSADNGIVYPLKDYNTGNIKIMEFGPAYPASETIPREDFLTDYGYGDEITLLDEEHYEGDNLLYTDFYHTWKYSSEMQRELEQYIYTVDRGGYSINVYAYPDDLFMTRWMCEEILKTLTIEKADTQRQAEVQAVSAAAPEELRESLQALETSLENESLSNSITYGVIDIDRDGSDEFFAVLSKGDQGYSEMRFYGADLTPLLLTDGFSRDGSTYFMYDGTNSCLLMFSDYTHSYFLKNEKVYALYGDGSMAEFFEAVWTADSPRENLKRTETYVNSAKVSETDYDSAYSEFIGGQLSDIYYIYDGKLFLGSEQVRSSGDVFDSYCQSRNAV